MWGILMSFNWKDPDFKKALRHLGLYLVSLVAAEATLLDSMGINSRSAITFGVFLKLLITFSAVTLPWLSDKPRNGVANGIHNGINGSNGNGGNNASK